MSGAAVEVPPSPAAGRTHHGDVIRCDGVVKRFGSVSALIGLDLTVEPGRIVGYLGPNGAGKSTTIRLLLDLVRPDAGQIWVFGEDPRRAGPQLRRRIGYLPGELRLDERLRVDEILAGWATLRGDVAANQVAALCERFGLDPSRSARGLSSGNRRKVGLVGAFMGHCELLILDEPTAGIDPLVQATFLDLLAEVRDEGRTVFLSSHVLSEVQRIADHVVVLRAGRVVARGSVDELRHVARQPFTVSFVDRPPEAALAGLGSVGALEVHDRDVAGVVEGSPDELLRVLARHRVRHLLMPEPDLETAFLRFYEEPS